jgi:Zn finger protein HypA/HybF involved in hydrogenase expression
MELGPYWMRVECQECGRKFKTRSTLPSCPKCGGSDIDLDYPTADAVRHAAYRLPSAS